MNEFELAETLAGSIRDFEAQREDLTLLCYILNDIAKAREQRKKQADRKTAKVVFKMTQGDHFHQIVTDNTQKAANDYDHVIHAYRMPAHDQAMLEAGMASGEITDEKLFKGIAFPRMHDAAFRRLVVDSTIKTEEAHNRSHRYTELTNAFLKTGDDLSYNEQKKFEQVWTKIMARLFRRLDLLLTSCNNAGNGIVEAGFRPMVIICNEARQVILTVDGVES